MGKYAEGYAYLLSMMNPSGFIKVLEPGTYRKIGGRYWKRMQNAQKIDYTKAARAVVGVRMKDPHIGDDRFNDIIKTGGMTSYIATVIKHLPEYASAKVADFPQSLTDNIMLSKGNYSQQEMLKNLAKYQANPNVEKSRARRYVGLKEGQIGYSFKDIKSIRPIKVTEEWVPPVRKLKEKIEVTREAQDIMRRHFDLIQMGVDEIDRMAPEEQHKLVIEGAQGGTNVGYPFFITQTKDNFVLLVEKWCTHTIHFNLQHWYTNTKDGPMLYLTVKLIKAILKYLETSKWYEPYMQWYRTSQDKVRAVFGGPMAMKLQGALIHAAKRLTQNVTYAKKHNIAVPADWVGEKYVPDINGIPFIGQLPWDDMFPMLLKLVGDCPADEDIVGVDFSGFDTGVIEEDAYWMCELGNSYIYDLLRYVFLSLRHAEVWCGPFRLSDIYWKSGHPFTSDGGSGVHINYEYAARNWLRRKGRDVELKHICVLADDGLSHWKGATAADFNDFLKTIGLSVKVDESNSLQRDNWVSFLKVLLIRRKVNEGQILLFTGDPVSRYIGLAHSERDLETEYTESMKIGANMRGMWKITGDIELDAYLSKLASYSKEGMPEVMATLRATKDTDLTVKAISVMPSLSNSGIKPYRDDIEIGFHPKWLASLPLDDLVKPIPL